MLGAGEDVVVQKTCLIQRLGSLESNSRTTMVRIESERASHPGKFGIAVRAYSGFDMD